MAFIRCPECESEISSSATHCVKCGCEITCCPECLAVYKGKADRCTNCGFEFNPNKAEEKTSMQIQTRKLEQQFDADIKTVKRVSIASRIIEIATLAIVVIGVIVYLCWENNSDAYEKFMQIKSVFGSLKFISIVALTLFILSFSMDDLAIYFLQLRRNNWLRNQKFDYKAYIKSYNSFGVEGEDSKGYLALLKKSVFMIENPKEKTSTLMIVGLQILLYVIADICACVWVFSNLNDMYIVKFISVSAQYSWQFNQASMIVAIIFIVMAIVVDCFASIPQDKRFDNWCNEFEKQN